MSEPVNYTEWKTKPIENWNDVDYWAWRIDMGQRLRQRIKKLYGYRKENAFAERIGISQGTLSGILRGISNPSAPTLLKCEMKTPIKAAWILHGWKINGKEKTKG